MVYQLSRLTLPGLSVVFKTGRLSRVAVPGIKKEVAPQLKWNHIYWEKHYGK
jgi:hypothetical protein